MGRRLILTYVNYSLTTGGRKGRRIPAGGEPHFVTQLISLVLGDFGADVAAVGLYRRLQCSCLLFPPLSWAFKDRPTSPVHGGSFRSSASTQKRMHIRSPVQQALRNTGTHTETPTSSFP